MTHRNSVERQSELNYRLQIKTKEKQQTIEVLRKVEEQKATSDAEVKAKAEHEAVLQKQIDDLNAQLQAKRDAQQRQSIASRVVNTFTGTRTASAGGACGDNSMANFIYSHESGCSLTSVNAIGCRGIGQACPGSKLPCGADYACQNAFFTNYANARYGGWGGAYAFWQSHRWW